jgi:hypothetical protein
VPVLIPVCPCVARCPGSIAEAGEESRVRLDERVIGRADDAGLEELDALPWTSNLSHMSRVPLVVSTGWSRIFTRHDRTSGSGFSHGRGQSSHDSDSSSGVSTGLMSVRSDPSAPLSFPLFNLGGGDTENEESRMALGGIATEVDEGHPGLLARDEE